MKVMVLGADGYLGRPTADHLEANGHEVMRIDSFMKRHMLCDYGLKPIKEPGILGSIRACDVAGKGLEGFIRIFRPDAIIHLAELPSAPLSMRSHANAAETYKNNVMSTLNLVWAVKKHVPECHIVKLGTMGEYGTPNIDIEEGWLDVEHKGRKDRVLYPKKPGSFYHLTKVHDSDMLAFCCRNWGMAVTDLNQGVVYGTDTGHGDTRFCYDHMFGTALNRFIVQAVAGVPLTVYGSGGQTRGWLNIKDTLECLRLAIEHPAEEGEFRVMNQFTEQFSVLELADLVFDVANACGLSPQMEHLKNPRNEMEGHYYKAEHTKLLDLGLEQTLLTTDVIHQMMDYVFSHKKNIVEKQIRPTVKW